MSLHKGFYSRYISQLALSRLILGVLPRNLIKLDTIVQLGQSLLLLRVFLALKPLSAQSRDHDLQNGPYQDVADVDGHGALGLAVATLLLVVLVTTAFAFSALALAVRLVAALFVVFAHLESVC